MRKLQLSSIALVWALGLSMMAQDAASPGFESREIALASSGPLPKYYSAFWWQSRERIEWLVARSADAKLNVIMPGVYGHGSYFFNTSKALYGKGVITLKGYDPLAILIEEAHKRKIKVIPYFPSLVAGEHGCLKRGSPDGKIAHEDWFNMDINGSIDSSGAVSYDAANPEFREYFASLVVDLAKYDIDGLALDYIRYMGPQWGYTAKARELFAKEYGVDPLDIVKNPQKIDDVKVFCLNPISWNGKSWYLSGMLRMMRELNVNCKIINETSDHLDGLPANSTLILASCYELSGPLITELDAFLEKGGNLIVIDGPTNAMNAHEKALAPILGVGNSHNFFPSSSVSIKMVGDHEILNGVVPGVIQCSGNSFLGNAPTTARTIAELSNGRPALLLNNYKNGTVALFNFDMLVRYSGECGYQLLRNTLEWLDARNKLRVYSYLPDEIGKKYPWIPAIIQTFFNNAKIQSVMLKDATGLERLSKIGSDNARKTALVYSTFFDLGGDAAGLVDAYVKNGGTLLLFMDADGNIKDMDSGAKVLAKYPNFLGGIGSGKTGKFDQTVDRHGHAYSILKFEENPQSPLMRDMLDTESEYHGSPWAEVSSADVSIRFSDNSPALFHRRHGEGEIWLFNYGVGSKGEPPAKLLWNVMSSAANERGVSFGSQKVAKLMECWDSWRCSQVTSLVKLVRETLQQHKPGIQLSVCAIDSKCPEKVVFQDWKQWLRLGYIDFVYPMNYYNNVSELERMLDWEVVGVDKRKIHPLLGMYKKSAEGFVPVSSAEIIEQLNSLRQRKFESVGFFCDEQLSDELVGSLAGYFK